MIDASGLNGVLELSYEAAVDDERLPGMLAALAGLFDARFADSFVRGVDFSWFGGIAHGLDADDYRDVFLGLWVKRNVWSRRRPVVRAGEILTTRDMVPVAELRRSEMFNEYLDARGLHEGLRFDLFADAEEVEDISILRDWNAGPYRDEELRAARLLLPHLMRSRLVARRLDEARMLAGCGLAALDRIRTPMLVLDGRGRAIHRNAAGRVLLDANDGIALRADGLVAATGAATARLALLVGRAAGTPGRSGAIRLPRLSGAPALMLVALPLGDAPIAAADGMAVGGALAGLRRPRSIPRVLLTIIDPAARTVLPGEQVATLFGLTPAEARLAADLLAGNELRLIAERSGRSINTVRSLLGRLMGKTGMRRQSELMRMLLQLPASDGEAGRGGTFR